MIWIATAATFGLVVCLVVYFFGSRIPRPSVMERIGGGGVNAFGDPVVEMPYSEMVGKLYPIPSGTVTIQQRLGDWNMEEVRKALDPVHVFPYDYPRTSTVAQTEDFYSRP